MVVSIERYWIVSYQCATWLLIKKRVQNQCWLYNSFLEISKYSGFECDKSKLLWICTLLHSKNRWPCKCIHSNCRQHWSCMMAWSKPQTNLKSANKFFHCACRLKSSTLSISQWHDNVPHGVHQTLKLCKTLQSYIIILSVFLKSAIVSSINIIQYPAGWNKIMRMTWYREKKEMNEGRCSLTAATRQENMWAYSICVMCQDSHAKTVNHKSQDWYQWKPVRSCQNS